MASAGGPPTSIGAKKKLNREDFIMKDKTGETLMKKPGQINGLDFQIKNLNDCTVYIFDTTAQLMIDKCTNTTFVVGPVKGSIFVRDCTNCRVSVACSQFRCRDLNDSIVYLYALNDPIIESSQNLKFAPYNVAYPGLDKQAISVGFDTSVNKWDLIFDFNKDENKQNFSFLDPSEFKIISKEIEGIDEKPVIVFPFPQKYGGSLADDANSGLANHNDGLMAFSITTSAADAAKKVQEVEERQQTTAPAVIDDDEPKITSDYNDDFDIFIGSNQQQNQQPPAQVFSGDWAFNQSAPIQQEQPVQNNDYFGTGENQQSYSPMKFDSLPQQAVFASYSNQFDDDMDDDERQRVFAAEQANQQRSHMLYQKQEEESMLKQKRRAQGKDQLNQWINEKGKQLEQRKAMNKQMEKDEVQEKKRLKETTNPWERVVSNVEINSTNYVGGADVTRMRQAMLARKSDLTKGGNKQSML